MMNIQVYASTTDAEEEELDGFSDQVPFEMHRTCQQSVLLVYGYWNAKVGEIKEEDVVV